MTKIVTNMIEDAWVDSSFFDELLEFTKANTVQRERKIQQARSRGADQKAVDRERKSATRDQDRQSQSTNPWRTVVIVRTNQDGKTRLIPRNDFEPNRHELLYGEAPGQPPKPEVTPNVAQEVASQDDFEASKTSNRLLGVIPRKKQPKQETIRSDHYDYPKDGVDRIDPTSTYPDWDHSPDSIAQGIALVASTAMGKEVNVDAIKGMFGASSTLMDSSIRAFQQIGDFVKGQFMVDIPDESYDTSMEWSQGAPTLEAPMTDMVINSTDGKVYNIAIVEEERKIIMSPESETLFTFSLNKVGSYMETEEKKTKKKLEKLKEKVTKFIETSNTTKVSEKYKLRFMEDKKLEIISDLETILESSESLEKMLVVEGLSGTEKFGLGSPAAANTLMSMSRDGTNLRMCPLDEIHIKRLLGETRLKIKLVPQMGESPFDQIVQLLDQKSEVPNLSEYFDIFEDMNDAKALFNQVMESNESILLSFFTLLGVAPENIVIENINLDAVGSISGGNYTKIKVNNRNYYIEVEKDMNYYDGSAIRIPPPPMPAPMMPMDPAAAGAPMPAAAPAPVQEDVDYLTEKKKRDYKKEYREYHSKKKQKKRRAGRNKIRRKYVKKHGKKALEGKDVDHKDYNPLNNCSDNVRLRDVSSNRGDNKVPVREEHGAGEEGTFELLLNYARATPGQQNVVSNIIKKGQKYATERRKSEDRYKGS